MKRPLAAVGFSMLITLFILCNAQSMAFAFAAFFASTLCLVLSLAIKKSRQTALLPTVFGSVAAACLLLMAFECFVFLPVEKLLVERGKISAVVLEYPYENRDSTRLYFTAKLEAVDGKKENAKVRLSFPAKPWKKNTPLLPEETKKLEPGDKITFVGNLYKIAGESDEIHNHFKSKGVCLASYPLGSVGVEKGSMKNFYTLLMKERKKAINQILRSFSAETSGVVISLLTGDKNYVSSELYAAYSDSGAAHLMAVSGLHLSVWIMFVLEILKKRNALTKKKIVLLMLFTVCIMFFASFGGSVMRAGFMMILYLFSELFGERADSLNSLGFCAICLFLQNPYIAVNAGFLLSFVSVLTIVLIALPLSETVCLKLKKVRALQKAIPLLRAVISSFFISFFIMTETLPFQIEYFGKVSVVGVLTNLFLLPVVTPMILCCGLYVMFYFLPLVSDLLLFVGNVSVGYCNAVVKFFSSFDFSSLSFGESAVPFAAVISIAVAATMTFILGRLKKRSTTPLFADKF